MEDSTKASCCALILYLADMYLKEEIRLLFEVKGVQFVHCLSICSSEHFLTRTSFSCRETNASDYFLNGRKVDFGH